MLLRQLLEPPAATLPRTFTAAYVGGDVAFAELRAAGHLVDLAPDVAVLPGLQVTRTDRLVALAHRIPRRTVVGRLSAVWVHTGYGDATTLAVLYPPSAHRPPRRTDLRTHQATLADDDVDGLGDLRVTGVLRTAADVARHVPRDAALAGLEALDTTGHLDVRRLDACLRAHRPGPRTAEALDVVAALLATRSAPPAVPRGASAPATVLPALAPGAA